MISIIEVQRFAPVIEAVLAGRKVRMIDDSGVEIVGTLRYFTPQGETVHFSPSSNLYRSWVQITTVQGFDTWVSTEDLADRHAEGAAQFS